MSANRDEEALLRSSALQNARSILHVRGRAEEEFRQQSEWLRVTLASIGDGVISTDTEGCVTFMNGVAQTLTGWSEADANGLPLDRVFRIVNESTRAAVTNPALKALKEGAIVGLANHTILISKDGTEWPIDDSAAPIRDDFGTIFGAVLVFREIQERKRLEAAQAERNRLISLRADVSSALASSHSVSHVLQECCQSLVKHLRAAFARIWTLNASGEMLELQASAGLYTHLDGPHCRVPVGQFKIGRIASSHEPHFTNNVPEDPNVSDRVWAAREGMVAFAGYPLIVEDRVVGVVAMFARDRLSDNVLAELAPFADSIAQFIDRKSAEEEVRKARSRLESTLAASEIGSWELHIPDNRVYADQNLAHMFGVNTDDANGGPLESFLKAIHPEDQERVRQTIAQALHSDGTYETEYRLRGLDERTRSVIARGRLERNAAGQPSRLCGVVVDVSTQRKAEDALRESELRRRLALDAAELGAWNIDPQTSTLTTDERFQIIFSGKVGPIGYEEAFAFIHPEDCNRVRDAVAAATRLADPATFAEEYRVVNTDGAVRWVFGKGRSHFSGEEEDRRLVSFDGTVADITERKQMENELRRIAADLSETDHRKNEFLAMLAHELRNPLAPISNALQILNLSAHNADQVKSTTAMMERHVRHLVRLVDDLLDVSRISQGKIDLRLERIELSTVIHRAVETSRSAIESGRHHLTVQLPPQPVFLHGDAVRLAQVFSNLLNNSSKYSDPEGRIVLSAKCEEKDLLVSVKDTGIGIPTEMLPKVFEIFTQVDRSLERSQGGLGIGLSLVRTLVSLHGGTVEAHSEGLDRGSEFIVRLPLPVVPAKPTVASVQSKPAAVASRRVLVVDDNRDSAISLAMLLKVTGHQTTIAHDGVEAVMAAEKFRPEVVLLDIGLPKLNGYEAARQIRKQPWGEKMVLFALTGWGQEEDRQKSKEAGFNGHMVKPVDHSLLTKLLADLPPSTS